MRTKLRPTRYQQLTRYALDTDNGSEFEQATCAVCRKAAAS